MNMPDRSNVRPATMSSAVSRRQFLGVAAGAGIAGLGLKAGAARHLLSERRDGSKVTTINFWSPSGDITGTKTIQNMVNSYNRGPGVADGVKVNLDLVSSADNSIKFTTGLTSGGPDVIMTYSYTPIVPWAATGLLLPLDSLLAEIGTPKSAYFPFVWDMQHFNGQTWSILQEWDAELLYANTELHPGPLPTSTDELDAYAKQATKFNKAGDLTQAGLIPWEEGGFSSGGYSTWGPIWGASFYDTTSGKWTITKPQNKKFLEWYLKYVDMLGGPNNINSYMSATPNIYVTPGYSLFFEARSAFSMLGEFFPQEYEVVKGSKANLHYAIQPDRLSAPGIASNQLAMCISADAFGISARTNNRDAAAKFLKYMLTTSVLDEWSVQNCNDSPTIAGEGSPALFAKWPTMRYWDNAAKNGYYVAQPPSGVYPAFDTAMGVAISDLVEKKMTPAQALSYVDNQVSLADQTFHEANPQWLLD